MNAVRPNAGSSNALLGALVLATVFVSLAVGLNWFGPSFRSLLLLLPDLLTMALMFVVTRQLERTEQPAWRWFAWSVAAYAVGDIIWTVLDLNGLQPFPSIAALFHGVFPILFLYGLFQLPGQTIPTIERFKYALDVVLIAATLIVFAWYSFAAPLVLEYTHTPAALMVGIALLFTKLVLCVTLLVPGFGQRMIAPGPHFGVMWLGITLLLAADTVFGDAQTPHGDPRSLMLYIWGIALFGVGTQMRLYAQRVQPGSPAGAPILRLIGAFLPYLAALASFGLLLAFMLSETHETQPKLVEQVLFVLTAIITLLSMARQSIIFFENRALNASLEQSNTTLEQRVAERGQELEASRNRLMAVERLATLGQLTAGLAHEVNTPLAAAMNTLEQAKSLTREYRDSIGHPNVGVEDHREIATELEAAIQRTGSTLERLGELVRKMRAQGRDHQQGHVRFDPVQAAREALALLEHTAMKARVDFRIEDISAGAQVYGETTRFMQIVTNLVQNAIHACEDAPKPEGSRVTLQFVREDQHLEMLVIDNGSGIPEDVQDRMFEALFTTKSAGRGTGLGLAIVQDIVNAHFAGTLEVKSTLGVGTTFTVRIPIVANTTSTGQTLEPSATLHP